MSESDLLDLSPHDVPQGCEGDAASVALVGPGCAAKGPCGTRGEQWDRQYFVPHAKPHTKVEAGEAKRFETCGQPLNARLFRRRFQLPEGAATQGLVRRPHTGKDELVEIVDRAGKDGSCFANVGLSGGDELGVRLTGVDGRIDGCLVVYRVQSDRNRGESMIGQR